MGSAFLELLIATGLLVTVLAGIAPLTAVTFARMHMARRDTVAAHLARQRLEQLEALAWRRGPAGVSMDVHAGFAADTFTQDGSGLTPTGPAPLTSDITGGVDWLDASGRFLSREPDRPPSAHYRRRWAVLAGAVGDCVQMWVVVSPLAPGLERPTHAGATHCAWGVAAP